MFNKLVQLPFSRKRVFKLVSVITNHLLGMTQAYIYKKKTKRNDVNRTRTLLK